MKISSFFNCSEILKDIIYPKNCIYCGKSIDNFSKLSICRSCKDIKAYPKVVRDDKNYFAEGFGIIKYDGFVRDAMLKFKFKSAKYYGYTFAYKMYEYSELFPYLKTSVICSIPISKSRFRVYNQSDVIAKEFAGLLGKTCVSDLIYKAKDVKRMSSMDKAYRRICIKDVFRVNPIYDIEGKDVVVVDDIFTSGTTANECAKALLCAGAAKVYIACVCYD